MHDNAAPFFGGFLMGSWSSINSWNIVNSLLDIHMPSSPNGYFTQLVSTIILGLVGGFGGMLAKDIYKHLFACGHNRVWIKNK